MLAVRCSWEGAIVRHRRDRQGSLPVVRSRNPPRRHGDTENWESGNLKNEAEKSSRRWQIYRATALTMDEVIKAKILLVNELRRSSNLAPELHFTSCPGGGQEIPHVRRTAPGTPS